MEVEMVAISSVSGVFESARVPAITADEAYALLRTELERMLVLADSMGPDDWNKPTPCTLWNVHDMLAHQAGAYASGTGYRELIRQYSTKPKPGQPPEDAVNALQVSERTRRSPQELIDEIRRTGPTAIRKWAYQFRLFKLVTIPHPTGKLSMRDLMQVIHSRDSWMHRIDLCRATGHKFEMTAGHDDRIVALIMADAQKVLANKIPEGRAVVYELSGLAGGTWKMGTGQPMSTIQMDAVDFSIYASGRFTYAEARAKANISGDVALAESILKQTQVLF
jgi:uncharacterized protein (TIGR03083 family)